MIYNSLPRKLTHVVRHTRSRTHAFAVAFACALTNAHKQWETRKNVCWYSLPFYLCLRIRYSYLWGCVDIVALCQYYPSYKKQKKKKKKKMKWGAILHKRCFFLHRTFLKHRFTSWLICKHHSRQFVTIIAPYLFTSSTIFEPVQKFFFCHVWIGNSTRIMMKWVSFHSA